MEENKEAQKADIFSMVELAKAFSEIINNKDKFQNEDNEHIDSIIKMSSTSESKSDNRKIHSNSFDEQFQTPQMMALKSTMPYLEPKLAKQIGVFVKLMEIKNLVDTYDEKITMKSSPQSYDNKKKMLMAIKPYCNEENKSMIDMFAWSMEMKEMMQLAESMKN